MHYTIVRSISTDLGGNVGIDSVKKAIQDASIAIEFHGIQFYDDTIEFFFATTLSESDLVKFNNALATYVYSPDAIPKRTYITVTPKITSTNNTSYTVIGSFQYLGSKISGTLNYIEIVSYADPSITSYDARIVVKSTGVVIASKTSLANKSYAIVDLGVISNVPTDPEILDLQVRKVGGPTNKYVYVDNIYIYN